MKKIFLIILLFFNIFLPSFAIEEKVVIDETPVELKDVVIEEEKLETLEQQGQVSEEEFISEEPIEVQETFRERVYKALTAEVEKTDAPYHMLHDFLTYKSETGLIEKAHLWGAYQGQLTTTIPDHGQDHTVYSTPTINVGIDGKFKGGKEDFRIMLGFSPAHGRTFWNSLPADLYIATNRIPHHRVLLGNSRPPVGMEGGQSPFTLPFINRSQISRTYGTVRKFGVRVMGNYDFIEYDLGGFSSDTYFKKFFPGVEFTGWATLKPLAKTNGKYGNLRIGGGINAGQYGGGHFFVGGAYVGYEYKRFFANFEWAQADGSNGVAGYSSKQSSGFYTTVGYKVTPKIQLVARYDQFDPDRNVMNNWRREISAGINYFVKGHQGLKFIFNYVFCQNQGGSDSHRIIVGTQILL